MTDIDLKSEKFSEQQVPDLNKKSESGYTHKRKWVKKQLSKEEYREFTKNFNKLTKEFGYEWKQNRNWEMLINQALCDIRNTFTECQPA